MQRNVCLTPSQQFMMITTLVVENEGGPYTSDISLAAEIHSDVLWQQRK